MNIKSKSSRKLSIIVALAATLILSGVLAFVMLNKKSVDSNTTQNQRQTESESNEKAALLDETKDDGSTTEAKPAIAPEDPNTIEIMPTQASGIVTLTTKLTGQGYSSGTCELTLLKGAVKHTEKAEIIYQPTYSTCAGFSIPVSTLGPGIWHISLAVTPLDGKTLTKTMSYEVN